MHNNRKVSSDSKGINCTLQSHVREFLIILNNFFEIYHIYLPMYIIANLFFSFLLLIDVPTALPPLTPGTNRKVNEVLKASFASWEKEVQNCNITKGNYQSLSLSLSLSRTAVPMHTLVRTISFPISNPNSIQLSRRIGNANKIIIYKNRK